VSILWDHMSYCQIMLANTKEIYSTWRHSPSICNRTDSVIIGNSFSLSIFGIGDSLIRQSNIVLPLHDVLFILIWQNLFYVSQLTTQFFINCKFSNVDFCVNEQEARQPVTTGRHKGDLYVLQNLPELYFSHYFKFGSAEV